VGGGGGSQLIFFVLMIGLLVFMFSRTRKQQKAQQQMQSSVAPGAEVMTTSGQFGTVVDVDGDVVTLEIAPGVNARFTRRAVARVVTPSVVSEAESFTADGTHGPSGDGLDLRKDPRGGLDGDAPRT